MMDAFVDGIAGDDLPANAGLFDGEGEREDVDEASLSDQEEVFEENAAAFDQDGAGMQPADAAHGVLQVAQVQGAFNQIGEPPVEEGVNPGDGNNGVNDDGPPPPPDPPAGGGGEPPAPPPLDMGMTLEEIRALLERSEMMKMAEVDDRARERAQEAARRLTEFKYAKASTWFAALQAGGVFLAVVAFVVDLLKKNSSSSRRVEHQAPSPTAGAVPSGIEAWVAGLPAPQRQVIQKLGDDWSALGELEIFQRASNFARKHPVHLSVYDHIQLLQLVRVAGSPRPQAFIWYASEKRAYVQAAAEVLNTMGYPAFYAYLTKASMNGRPLPRTIAAYAGQLAVMWVYASRSKAAGGAS
ncbi:Hypothetical protein A7982_03813 [Minicystis rosea]|nr:Hypothetical protein A7982_03813 [Minicystis rosea]